MISSIFKIMAKCDHVDRCKKQRSLFDGFVSEILNELINALYVYSLTIIKLREIKNRARMRTWGRGACEHKEREKGNLCLALNG